MKGSDENTSKNISQGLSLRDAHAISIKHVCSAILPTQRAETSGEASHLENTGNVHGGTMWDPRWHDQQSGCWRVRWRVGMLKQRCM
jgi:hypothetical protein